MSDIGNLPELAWLPVDKLSVDPAYQRTIDSRASLNLIERIAVDFRWAAFGCVMAVKRGDRWEMIDGQHRVAAAKRRGIKHVPAVVVDDASTAELAKVFVRANLDRVPLNPFALHHARIAAGDEGALAIQRVCAAARVSIPRYASGSDQLQPRQTTALGAIALLIRKHGEDWATVALRAAAEPRPADGDRGIRAALIRAIEHLLNRTDRDQRTRMFKALSTWLSARTGRDLHMKAVERKGQRGGNEVSNLVDLMRAGASTAAAAPMATGGIKGPTRDQLMGRRA